MYKKHTHSILEKKVSTYLLGKSLPNVVSIYNVENAKGFVAEVTMEKLVVNPQTLTVLQRSQIITDMLNGLLQLQSHGIIYADIKLGNIGWSYEDSCWKIFDFDASCFYEKQADVKELQEYISDMGYPEDILSGASIEDIQNKLNQFMLPSIINDELAKFILNPNEVYD